jgi:hypothetical protein
MPELRIVVRTDLAQKLGLDPRTTTFTDIRKNLEGDDPWGAKQVLKDEMNRRLDGAHPVP